MGLRKALDKITSASGDSVDVEDDLSLEGNEITRVGASNGPVYAPQLVLKTDGRNETIDVTNFDTSGYFALVAEGGIQSGTQGGNNCRMRINGLSGSEYDYTERSGTSLNRVTGQSEIDIADSPAGGSNDRDLPFRMMMPLTSGGSGDDTLYISFDIATGGRPSVLDANVELGQDSIETIDFFSSGKGFTQNLYWYLTGDFR